MIIKDKSTLYLYVVIGLCAIWSAYRIITYDVNLDTSSDEVKVDSLRQQVPLTQVRIYNPIRNVGQIKKGDLITEEFIIENIGNNPLHLWEVIPDCTCTNYSLSERIVPVGSHTILTLFVDTKNRVGTNSLNTLLSLNTNEKNHILLLQYNVINSKKDVLSVSGCEFGCDTLNVGIIQRSLEYEFSNLLKNVTDKEIAINNLFIANEYMTLKQMPNTLSARESTTIKFYIRTEFSGEFEEMIALNILPGNRTIYFIVKGVSV
ncbi:MAG: DUF1573 domain-containing protein [Bacteroidales bacterium]|nr:DUF1573 domain-containing protein [Bacteroidales bacterium]